MTPRTAAGGILADMAHRKSGTQPFRSMRFMKELFIFCWILVGTTFASMLVGASDRQWAAMTLGAIVVWAAYEGVRFALRRYERRQVDTG